MIIEEKDFIAKSIGDDCPLFDLDLLVKVNAGKSNEREEFKNVAYGIPMEGVLKRVAHYRVCRDKSDKEVISLHTYMEEYNKAVNELKALIQ